MVAEAASAATAAFHVGNESASQFSAEEIDDTGLAGAFTRARQQALAERDRLRSGLHRGARRPLPPALARAGIGGSSAVASSPSA
jgi:hypothetical protein